MLSYDGYGGLSNIHGCLGIHSQMCFIGSSNLNGDTFFQDLDEKIEPDLEPMKPMEEISFH